jgi:hypothetical protein
MRRILLTTSVLFALIAGAARPAAATEVGYGRNFGLGFVLGDPTGIVGKYWVSKTNALDFGVGFYGYALGTCTDNNPCNAGYQNFSFWLDYLWQSNLVKAPAVQLDWHIGAGGRAIVWGGGGRDHVLVGGRMPVGLDLMFTNPNFVEIYFELAPAIYIDPALSLNIEVGLGVRFYF